MKVSDEIMQFIMDVIGDGASADINRNELASYFRCAPSQINYVLQTRFTVDRGFRVESKRGGGGYIRIEKICVEKKPYLYSLYDLAGERMSVTRARQIIENLTDNGYLTDAEASVLTAATSEKALSAPANLSDGIRCNIMRETLLQLIKR